ncbi:MAG: amino acid ABC transporter substrate-binding protein [Rhodospirillales bacterium]|nr:amino acid ABC transporter substrate-binding protein [Rhodospirillales bacterium]
MMRWMRWAFALLAVLAGMTTTAAADTLETVRNRGWLTCGVANDLPGFSAPDAKGHWTGLDVDVCRAVAAAVFGTAEKVRFVPLNAQARLTALQSGEIDVLARNTTFTLTRDTAAGINFTVINYYDGQGFLVRKSLGVASARQLSGASVCLQTGTTTELNLADFARAAGLDLRPVTIEKYEEMVGAYLAGRCDALSADASALATIRANATPDPDAHVVLPELISKEPLAPAVRQGDDRWFDIVKWSQFAMIEAEERGIDSHTVDAAARSDDPGVARLLGATPGAAAALGLADGWARAIIHDVGNYAESFDRNLGAGSALKLPRGANALWTKGGLMYAMPFR